MRKSSKLLELLCETLEHEGQARKYRGLYEELYSSLDEDEKKMWEWSSTYNLCIETYEKKFREGN